jgi:hypothetical protein
MRRRTWLRLARKLRKTFNPVNLGQTRGGLIVVAVLIAGWQLSAPVRAEIASGSSSNEYFRIEWWYDMDDGMGWMSLGPAPDHWWRDYIIDNAHFVTAGRPFEEMSWEGNEVFNPPTLVGNDHGLPLYEYRALAPLFISGDTGFPNIIDLRFNPENAELRATTLRYDAYPRSPWGGFGLPLPTTQLPFVPIQTIPEPAAVATMALAAAALAATRRRNGNDNL